MTIEPGTTLPDWTVESVPEEKMKTMALLLRDPNPIHWDVEAVRRLGLGNQVVNQGPTNKAYIINMLIAWLGDPLRIRSITVRFRTNVYAGERVTAGGTVTAVREEDGGRIADCDVWLRKDDGTDAIVGTASVAL
jgi:acyl dehydratase